MLGLALIIVIVKLTRIVVRRRKHAERLGQYEEHLGSKEDLIQEMSGQTYFETHNVIVTRPDGSRISPLSSSRGDSRPSPPFRVHAVGCECSKLSFIQGERPGQTNTKCMCENAISENFNRCESLAPPRLFLQELEVM